METDEDERALEVFMEAIEEAQGMDRHSVRDQAAEQFDNDRIVDDVITPLHAVRLSGERIRTNRGSEPKLG